MIQISLALNTSYIQQTSYNRENPKQTTWEQAKINQGKGYYTLNHPTESRTRRSTFSPAQSRGKARAHVRGPSRVVEPPGKWDKGPGIIWELLCWVHASSSSQDAGTYFTFPWTGQLSSRQLQLHHTVWLRQHTRELENMTNFGICKCNFGGANNRKSVPNLDQKWIFWKSLKCFN